MRNVAYTKIFKCFINLCPWLSEAFSFPLYIFDNDSNYLKFQYFCLKRKVYQKNTSTKVESFLMTLSDLNQIGKVVFTKNCFIYNFCAMHSHYICIKGLRKALKRSKRSQHWSLQETGTSYKKNILHLDNRAQNLRNNVKKSSKIGQDKKTLKSVSA